VDNVIRYERDHTNSNRAQTKTSLRILTGTSGFSYKEWKGAFYPADLKNAEMLAYYATRLPAVEINNTFYRLPRASMLQRWADEVPAEFRFILKASRTITHFKRLKEAEEVTRYLIETARGLGDRLGVILFQCPPNFDRDIGRLRDFVTILPDDIRFAFEFRHRKWFDDEVYEVLSTKNIALCTAEAEGASADVVRTADWGYLRLRRQDYTEADLDAWADRITAQNWKAAYVLFKHEDDAAGPNMAESFLNRFSS
jgi:uncharacterized protein YecE (DUF72 family)